MRGFPNFFCLYGPNTQPGHGGSIIWSVETQARYVVGLLVEMAERGTAAIEVREDVAARYNQDVDRRHARMV